MNFLSPWKSGSTSASFWSMSHASWCAGLKEGALCQIATVPHPGSSLRQSPIVGRLEPLDSSLTFWLSHTEGQGFNAGSAPRTQGGGTVGGSLADFSLDPENSGSWAPAPPWPAPSPRSASGRAAAMRDCARPHTAELSWKPPRHIPGFKFTFPAWF